MRLRASFLARLPGMSLIELMATLTILAILTILAVPSFRSFQGRQSLLYTQKSLQSLLYRSQQLALAPSTSSGGGGTVVGYGVSIVNKSGTTSEKLIGGCTVLLPNDLVALLAIVKLDTGKIDAYLADSTDFTTPCANKVNPTDRPNVFYVLPTAVKLVDATPALPWLIVTPLQATGESYGPLCHVDQFTCGTSFVDPLFMNTQGALKIRSTSIKDPTQPTKFLCREIDFSKDATVQASGKVVPGGCS